MENEGKIRLLTLYKVLYERTDAEHPLSTAQLIDILANEYSISAHRSTITKDADVLISFGINVIRIESTQNKYYIGAREFETSELKLLIDAVESSKFITENKSQALVSKLSKLTSENISPSIKRNLCTEGRIKPGNEKIYSIVDTINDAINQGKQISFQYFQYDLKKHKKLRNNGESYIFSPYSLVWNGDYYYVIGYSDKYNGIGTFRVDRIADSPKILKDASVPMPQDFSLAHYVTATFRMFNKEPEIVDLICENSVIDAIIDRFGEDIKIYANDLNTFRIVVDVATTHIFYSWVFGFQGKVKIKGPENVKNTYNQMVKTAAQSL